MDARTNDHGVGPRKLAPPERYHLLIGSAKEVESCWTSVGTDGRTNEHQVRSNGHTTATVMSYDHLNWAES
jgi:hypothetical protein